MVREVLKLYTDNGLGDNNPRFLDIEITEYQCKRTRMGVPTLTATLMWPTALDAEWTGREYTILNGERWYLRKTPSGEIKNPDGRYSHSLDFKSGWEVLTQVLFYDVVTDNAMTKDRPCSNSSDVTFYGTIREFVDRLNCAFLYAKVGDSILSTKTTLTQEDTPVGDGFCAILNEDGEGDLSANVEWKFTDQKIWDVIADSVEQTNIPFSLREKAVVFNEPAKVVNHVFKQDITDALLSISKTNTNNSVINRITFKGSTENIEYYYPNETEYGGIGIVANSGNKVITANDIEIEYPDILVAKVGQNNTVSVDKHVVTAIYPESYSLKYNGQGFVWSHPDFGKSSSSADWLDVPLGHLQRWLGNSDDLEHDIYVAFALRFSTVEDGDVRILSIDGKTTTQRAPGEDHWGSAVTNIFNFSTDMFRIAWLKDSKGIEYTERIINEEVEGLRLVDLPKGSYELRFGMSWQSDSEASNFWMLWPAKFEQDGKREYFWRNNGEKIAGLGAIGLSIKKELDSSMVGDSFHWEALANSQVAYQTNLMPPIYTRGKAQGVTVAPRGVERFYNAVNETYKHADGTFMAFPHPYIDGNPNEYVYINEDIKPTIEGVTNAVGELMGEIADIAFDSSDNDSMKVSGDSSEDINATYEHPYFYIKLNLFNGEYGFDLFKSASRNNPMTIQMTSGPCNGCKFKIYSLSKTEDGVERFYNPVLTEYSASAEGAVPGYIVSGEYGSKMSLSGNNLQEWQQDSRKNALWICLQKENETFGVIMPNVANNYKPKVGDKFNIINIQLPQGYIDAAEDRGEREMLDALLENNEEKFTFNVELSRIFFVEHPEILAELDENSLIDVEYDGKIYRQYVSELTLDVKDNDALPEIGINLVDTISVGNGFIEEVAVKAAEMIGMTAGTRSVLGSSTGGGLTKTTADKTYLNKTKADRSEYKISSDSAFEVGEFFAGSTGGIMQVDSQTGQSYIEVDRLRVRLKAIFEELEIAKVSTVRGESMITPGGSVHITVVENIKLEEPITLRRTRLDASGNPDRDESGNILYDEVITENVYRCYFKQSEDDTGIENSFRIGDEAYCKEFNISEGEHTSATNQYYWRAVVNVSEDGYIDLSAEDCDEGSDVPMAGDIICQKGSHEDLERQSAIVMSTVNASAPSVTLYNGITAYNVNNKSVVEYGVDKSKNPPEPFFNCYGRMYIGPRSKSSYIEVNPTDEEIILKGKIISSSTIDNTPIDDYISDKADSATQDLRDRINELQNQVDGVVETWNGDVDPTLQNYPASEWVTEADKIKHAGDVYFNVGAYNSATNPNAGAAWRWYYVSSEDYGWIKIADSDAVKALLLAQMSVTDTDVMFIQTDSPTATPQLPIVNSAGVIVDAKGWQTLAPAWEEDKYIWQTTYVRRGDGSAAFTNPVCISGKDGKGIARIIEEYYLSTSRTQLLGGSWSEQRPTWVAGCYYWTRSHIYYTDGTDSVTSGICVTGESGSSVLAEYSADAITWHPIFLSSDIWMHTSSDNGLTWGAAIKIVGEDGEDGQWRKFQWAVNTSAITAPTGIAPEDWKDSPVTSSAGEYVWMRSGLVVPPATTPTLWDSPTRLTGDKGDDGQSSYMLDLSNEVAGILCNSGGEVIGNYPTSKATVFKGASKVTSGITYSIAQTDGISSEGVTIDAAGNIRMDFMTADTATIVVQAVVEGVTLQSTINLYKVKPGARGSAAVIYSLEPSVNNVSRSMTGELSTGAVTCDVYKTTGESIREKTSEKTLTYQRIPNDAAPIVSAHDDGTSIAVGILSDTESVIFELKDGDVILDRERVPIIADASDLAIGGTNLLRNSGQRFEQTYSEKGDHYTILPERTIYMEYGKTYTVSARTNGIFTKNHNSGSDIGYVCLWLVSYSNSPQGSVNAIISDSDMESDGSKGHTFTWNKPTGTYMLRINFYAAGTWWVEKVKIERGNVATEWSPSPNDFDYLTEAIKGNTQTDGGLVLSSLIKLGTWSSVGVDATMNAVYSGINGIYQSDKTIATWWGGDMVDRYYDNAGVERISPLASGYASGLVRMDGTGYLAKGNISWDESGAAKFAGGQMWIDAAGNLFFGGGVILEGGDANRTLSNVMNYLSLLNTIFVPENDNGSVLDWTDRDHITRIRVTKTLYSEGGLSCFGYSDVSGGGSGGGGYYGRLDDWDDYVQGSTEVLSAKLGVELKEAIDDLPTTSVNPHSLTFGTKTYDGSKATTLLLSDLDGLPRSGGSMSTTDCVTNLNADLLDGLHANQIFRNARLDVDIDTLIDSGAYRVGYSNPNLWPGGSFGQLIVIRGGGDTIAQIGICFGDARMYIRSGNPSVVGGVGSWTDWKPVAFSADNAPSATKLNTARNLWGVSFNGTADISGSMTINGNLDSVGTLNSNQVKATEINAKYIELKSPTPFIDFHFNNSDADYTHRIIANSETNLNITSDLTINNNTVWHAGNDGTGSGLDADLLDGKHAVDIFRNEYAESGTSDLNSLITSGAYRMGGGNANLWPGGAYGQLLVVRGAGDTIAQIGICCGGTHAVYVRSGNPPEISSSSTGGWGAWQRLAFSTDTAPAATKLATSRSLWGRSFDGTSDVSGNMTGVGSITATGTFATSAPNGVIITYNGYSTYMRGDESSFWLLISNRNEPGFNSLRPFQIRMSDGRVTIAKSFHVADGGIATATNGLNVSGGTLRIGGATLSWDSENNALRIDKTIYSKGGVSALYSSAASASASPAMAAAQNNNDESEITLESLAARISALEAENEQLKQRLDALEGIAE